MSNYFDNQTKWSWKNDGEKVMVTTEHSKNNKVHSHTLDITEVPIGEMVDNTGIVMGDAHRAASHDYKDTTQNNVSKMRAEMKQSANTAKGQLNQNGQMHTSVKVSSMANGQTTSMGKSSYGSSGSIGVSGTYGNSSGTSGHGSSGIGGNGGSSGGHGASSGGIGGHGGH